MNASRDLAATSRASTVRSAIGCAWIVLVAVTALGHATALRNTLAVLVPVATLGLYARDWRALPCKTIVFALVAWAVASLAWSAAPATTSSKLRTDLLVPLLAGIAAFHFAREGRGLRYVIAGLIVGLAALASLSAFAYAPVRWIPASWPLEQAGGIPRLLPHWYPGPGDTSMYTILAIAPLCLAWRSLGGRAGVRRLRLAVFAGAVLLAFALVTTNNRNAVMIAPVILLFQWLLDRRVAVRAPRPRSARRLTSTVAAGVVAVATLSAVLEYGARERLQFLHRPLVGDSAAVELASSDTRPMIWHYYLARGSEHPWIGMGFGRTVPGIGFDTQADRALAAVEPNAYIHAHNLAIDWWLQLGAVGLLLLVAAIVFTIAAARASARRSREAVRSRHVEHALFATLFATLARNLTDDFMVFGMATVFCIVVAAMLGELSRLAQRAP